MNRLGRLHSLSDQLKKLGSGATSREPAVDATGWVLRRGEIRASVECDVIGNFPGFHQSAALIVGARTLLTRGYLIVDEGEPHGFALPLTSVTDVSLDEAPHAGPDLLIRYHVTTQTGWFRLRESRGRLGRKGTKGIEALRSAFRAGGVSFGDAAGSFNAYLLVHWDAAASFETDRVVWTGNATAPIRATLECAPTAVWLTATSLIWGGVKGQGVNRLPLTAIRGLSPVTLSDPESTPAVYISTFGPENIPVSLPFIFDSTQNVGPERDAFLALFSPSLLTEIDALPPVQPWNDPEPDPIEVEDTEADVTDDLFAEDQDSGDVAIEAEEVAESEPEVEPEEPVPAWETWTAARPPSRFGIDPGGSVSRTATGIEADIGPLSFDSTGMRLTEALSVWPSAVEAVADAEPEPLGQAPLEPAAIPAYLAAARKAIDEVNDVINRRMAGNSAPSPRSIPPSTEQQAAALAELVELVGSGHYGAEASRAVKTQITRIGEAAIRIRSLLELCNAGHMTIAEVGAKRDVIMKGLPADATE
jgi:hypothetical protein